MIIIHLCSLALFLVVTGCWIFPKKIKIEKNILFPVLLITTFICIIFDLFIAYSFEIINIPKNVQVLLMKTYYIIMLCVAYLQFAFLINESLSNEVKKKIIVYSIIPLVVFSLLALLLRINIDILPNGLDIYGPSLIFYYSGVAIIDIIIVFILIKYRNDINSWHKKCYLSIIFVWLSFIFIQIISTRLGYISMAAIVSLLPMFIFIENPLNYIDYEYSCFKNSYIEPTLKKIINTSNGGFAILIDINGINNGSDYHKAINSFKKELIKTLTKRDALYVFITEKNKIFIIGEKLNKYSVYKDMICTMIESYYKSLINKQSFRAVSICCCNVKMFSHETEIIDHLKRTQQELSNNYYHNILFEITNADVNSMLNEKYIKDEILSAYNEDRIEAFVQPIYSVEKKKIVSAEALARIRKKDGTIMLPYEFIPVSEKYGIDILIGYRIIEKICQMLHSSIAGQLFEYIDINLSIAQCEASNLATKIIGITQKYDIKPHQLNFEITETGFINKMSNIEVNIKILTSYGFGFSLDDFGSGESNLNYLIKMPVSYVKLDMYMIRDYFNNERAKKIIQTIIKISHGMKLKIIAEGVETEEQFEELSKHGIDYVQGYFFYKPMTISEYLEIVKNNSN